MPRLLTAGLLACTFLLAGTAHAAGWRVIPIRLDFDQKLRSGVITLVNDSDQPISFSVEAMEWTQDSEGKDEYTPTAELLFFPKTLALPPHEERIIRAGLKVPPVKQEKTFRLFIKEEPPKKENPGTTVSIAVRFGVPVFAKPVREELRGEISRAELAHGSLNFSARNTGNVHFRIDITRIAGLNATGEEIFSKDLQGWYLLANAGRSFTISVPEATCRQLKTIDIHASGNKVEINGKVDVDPALCSAQ